MQFTLREVRRTLNAILPVRHMTTAERRRIQRETAMDPEVDRAVREALARNPRFRRQDRSPSGVQDSRRT